MVQSPFRIGSLLILPSRDLLAWNCPFPN